MNISDGPKPKHSTKEKGLKIGWKVNAIGNLGANECIHTTSDICVIYAWESSFNFHFQYIHSKKGADKRGFDDGEPKTKKKRDLSPNGNITTV